MLPYEPTADDVTRWALAAATGDDHAMALFVRATQTEVWRLCVHLGDQWAADDLTQETYLRAFANLATFAARSSAKTWLLSIARRVCADHVREQRRIPRLVATEPPERGAPGDFTTYAALRSLIDALDPVRREAFVLTQVIGASYAEAADICGCPVGTIRSRVARARTDLVEAVREHRGLSQIMGSTRWEQLAGSDSGRDYAERLAQTAATGVDMHGEATFCASLVSFGARILDGGCGTGRVAIRLEALGFEVVGVDADPSMIEVAAETNNQVPWHIADLASFHDDEPYDLIVLAGNVISLLPEGGLHGAILNLRRLLTGNGLLVSGFGLDAEHLPQGCDITTIAQMHDACIDAELSLIDRFGTWDRAVFEPGNGYAVNVYRAAG